MVILGFSGGLKNWKEKMNNPIEIYQTENGETQVEVRFEQETVWLSQAQIVELFGRAVSVIQHCLYGLLS